MNTFSAKSTGLYLLAIGSSIGFFCLVTNYGEANIKARKDLSGSYLITAKNLPGCLHDKQLFLNLQQSGIYVNASLADKTPTTRTMADTRLTLSGKLNERHPKLNLSGRLPSSVCPQPSQMQITAWFAPSANQSQDIRLQGGKMWLLLADVDPQQPSTDPGTEFAAILQPIERDNTSKSSH